MTHCAPIAPREGGHSNLPEAGAIGQTNEKREKRKGMVEMFKCPEQYRSERVELSVYGERGDETNGCFDAMGPDGYRLVIIASGGGGWEHVSVHRVGDPKHAPSWDEMCYVRQLFWEKEDTVMQLHPAGSKYVNTHSGTLHLWRPIGRDIPLPPIGYV